MHGDGIRIYFVVAKPHKHIVDLKYNDGTRRHASEFLHHGLQNVSQGGGAVSEMTSCSRQHPCKAVPVHSAPLHQLTTAISAHVSPVLLGLHQGTEEHRRLTTPSHSAVRSAHVAFENSSSCFVIIQRILQRQYTKIHRSAACVPFTEGPTQHRRAGPSSEPRDESHRCAKSSVVLRSPCQPPTRICTLVGSLQQCPLADPLHDLPALLVRSFAHPMQLHRLVEAGEAGDIHQDLTTLQKISQRHCWDGGGGGDATPRRRSTENGESSTSTPINTAAGSTATQQARCNPILEGQPGRNYEHRQEGRELGKVKE
jgi:hypothetical protein